MLDIQLLRNNLPEVARRLAARGVTLDTDAFRALEDERRDLQTRTQELQAKRNSASKLIGQLKAKQESASASRWLASTTIFMRITSRSSGLTPG